MKLHFSSLVFIFRSTLHIRVDLIKPVSNVRPTCVRIYVSPSTKSIVDFNEIWPVGRGR